MLAKLVEQLLAKSRMIVNGQDVEAGRATPRRASCWAFTN